MLWKYQHISTKEGRVINKGTDPLQNIVGSFRDWARQNPKPEIAHSKPMAIPSKVHNLELGLLL
jgi:hypothetical protein